MTFKTACIACCFWGSVIASFCAETDDANPLHASAVARPLVFRGDFMPWHVRKALKLRSGLPEYGLNGAPKFNSVWTRPVGVAETGLAQTPYYARNLNKLFWQEEVSKNLSKYRKILHPNTIFAYESGNFSRVPRLKSGEVCVWHHDVKKQYQLVRASEHGRLRHTGGNTIWGNKFAKSVSPGMKLLTTAFRWTQFSALDFAVSSSFLWLSGERELSHYLVEAGGSVAAGTLAWGTESILVCALPNSAGSAPYIVGGIPFLGGGVATWVATGVFIASKELVGWAWNEYQKREAERVERLCREAEREYRLALLKQSIERNTQALTNLLNNQ